MQWICNYLFHNIQDIHPVYIFLVLKFYYIILFKNPNFFKKVQVMKFAMKFPEPLNRVKSISIMGWDL
jgi:hypothetical protein